MGKARGRLIVIGGEERKAAPEPDVLARFGFHAGGANGCITVLAPELPVGVRGAVAYRRILRAVGVEDVVAHTIKGRDHPPDLLARVERSTGLLLIGGDPHRLVELLANSPLASAIARAFDQGACVGGVGAGAAALASHVVGPGAWVPPLQDGEEGAAAPDAHPRAGLVALFPGLGLVDRLVIDHHFCEKQRLGRLASLAAVAPELLGVGVDVGTALIISPGRGVEVVGRGAVTIFDGSGLSHSSLGQAAPGETLALCHVQLNLLPAGFAFRFRRGGDGVLLNGGAVPPRLQATMGALATSR